MIRRSDAFGNALDALETSESAYPDTRAEYVEIVREEFRQASEAFKRYRDEVGLPDPPSRKNSQKLA